MPFREPRSIAVRLGQHPEIKTMAESWVGKEGTGGEEEGNGDVPIAHLVDQVLTTLASVGAARNSYSSTLKHRHARFPPKFKSKNKK